MSIFTVIFIVAGIYMGISKLWNHLFEDDGEGYYVGENDRQGDVKILILQGQVQCTKCNKVHGYDNETEALTWLQKHECQ